MDIEIILKKIKKEFDHSIKTATFNGSRYSNGNKAKEALIRSQKIINYIHEYVKSDFVNNGVKKNKIYPPLNKSNPELKIKGFLKSKNQDVSILPSPDYLEHSLSGDPKAERIITVNIRSQLSSLQKNIDTLYERTFAEALNLHLLHPRQCLGEVYLIPTHEYSDKEMLRNKVAFKPQSKIEDFIKMFQAINNRNTDHGDEYKYERVCLLIADFRKQKPKLYSTTEDLKKDHLVRDDFDFDLAELSINNFAKDLLEIYKKRFGNGI
ncbi:MAG: restriction endonuclease [Candidatus Parcubacteria bacterium]|nr:restriction endonuclease [Candidatus Parcubacteria bacterium]